MNSGDEDGAEGSGDATKKGGEIMRQRTTSEWEDEDDRLDRSETESYTQDDTAINPGRPTKQNGDYECHEGANNGGHARFDRGI